MHSFERRDFLKKAGGLVSAISLGTNSNKASANDSRPNILVIVTDQQSAKMMGCAGNSYVKTPAMDRLASDGVRFERAYCTDPVCIPSRFSLMTGRMPSEIALRNNELDHIDKIPGHIISQGMGRLFKSAGYEAAFGGKEHLPKMDVEDLGFDYICEDERDKLSDVCSHFVRQDRDKPFLLVASFINPHDICYMALRDFAATDQARQLIKNGVVEVETLDEALKLPEGISRDEFFSRKCPPLPANFKPQENEPEAIRDLLATRPFRKNAREKWTEERWRMHRWAYMRLTEMVDKQIGALLDTLRDSGKDKNTIVIFTSDHGDMDSAHGMEHKTAFYDEAANIPMIVSGPGVERGVVDSDNLISNGLDIYPTICDYASIDTPAGLKGQSFRSIVEGKCPAEKRECVPLENEIGRMIVTHGHKYQVYDKGANSEQLIDLKNDPGEMRNAIDDPGKKSIVQHHRKLFDNTFRAI